jgi:hypothetical protein
MIYCDKGNHFFETNQLLNCFSGRKENGNLCQMSTQNRTTREKKRL